MDNDPTPRFALPLPLEGRGVGATVALRPLRGGVVEDRGGVKELTNSKTQKLTTMKKSNIWELILKVLVAAITAALTALTTTSCLGFGPL